MKYHSSHTWRKQGETSEPTHIHLRMRITNGIFFYCVAVVVVNSFLSIETELNLVVFCLSIEKLFFCYFVDSFFAGEEKENASEMRIIIFRFSSAR